MFSLPVSIKRIGSKTTEKRWIHRFPHYKLVGAFCCRGNQNFDSTCPKILHSLSPTPVMLDIKFDQGWPTGFRDIQVWMCGRRTDDGWTTDHWYTISLGELKKLCQNICSEIAIKTYFHLSLYKFMETLSCHSNESTWATAIKNLIFVEANIMNISAKFQLHPPYGFWGDDFLILFLSAMATNQIQQSGQNSYAS